MNINDLTISECFYYSQLLRRSYYSNPFYFIPTKKNRKMSKLIRMLEARAFSDLDQFKAFSLSDIFKVFR